MIFLIRILLLCLPLNICLLADSISRDIVIYGGNSAAISAAVQAKRMGKSVVVVSPDHRLGGLTSNGLGWTDSGKKEVVGGIAREFYHRVWRHYQSPEAWQWQKLNEYGNRGQGSPAVDGVRRTMWIFEPRVAEQIFESWVKENNLEVFRNELLDREKGVEKENGRITAITCLSGNRYEGKVYLDCTYEGDLMAAAGVSYFVGREGNAQYGETLNGVQTARAIKNQFVNRIDPYVLFGKPESGLLSRISPSQPGTEGSRDSKLQAYNFRLCLTQVEENRIPFPQPDKYNPMDYELLKRTLDAGSRHIFEHFDPIPNAKTDTSNHGSFSTDNIGMNYGYPDGSYEERRKIIAEHENYQKGYFYFLCNDPGVPEDIRLAMSKWGLARDEFTDNENWPSQIYVREARRMVSDFVMTEYEVTGLRKSGKPIAMGSYTIDSHNVQRYVAKDEQGRAYVLNEGDFQVPLQDPYPISYDSIVPRLNECSNLLVPVCLSASHVAFGSIRMEPVFMILGQSAATAAALAVEAEIPVQGVNYNDLRVRLQEDQQVLEVSKDNRITEGVGIPVSSLGGVVVDGEQLILEGEWVKSSSLRPFVGSSYFHDGNGGKGMRQIKFPFSAPSNGLHEIKVSYPTSGNRAGNIRYEVMHEEGLSKVLLDQRKPHLGNDTWSSLGTFTFKKGKSYEVILSNENTEGYVVADAIQVVGLTP
jgi:hypothetical protein